MRELLAAHHPRLEFVAFPTATPDLNPPGQGLSQDTGNFGTRINKY